MIENIPLVSILIPVYNREKIVLRAINAALSQTYENIEIIVVDNSSTDNTWNVVCQKAQSDTRIKAFKNDENVGPVKNWVECLRHANGKYVKFLWSDDSIESTFVEKCVAVMEHDDSVGFVYTKTKIIMEELTWVDYAWGASGKYKAADFVESSLLGKKPVPVSPGCALFRKKDVDKNLLIDIPNPKNLDFSRYGAGNDLLLFLEACNDYENFYYIDEMLSIFYGGKDSFSIANPLDEYYRYSRVYFLKNNKLYKKTRDKYFSIVFIIRKYRYMLKNEPFSFSALFVCSKIIKKIFKKRK